MEGVKESKKQRLFEMRFLLAPGAAGADARLGAPSATHAPEVGTPGPLPANQHPGPGSDPHLVLQYCPISERVSQPRPGPPMIHTASLLLWAPLAPESVTTSGSFH